MADITIPALVDGNVLSSSAVSTALYDDGAGTNSFEMINGRLDNNNRAAGWYVEASHIQQGAVSGGKTVGATANSDLFGDSFGDWDLATNDLPSAYEVIPGAAQDFYLPYNCSLVIFTWSVTIEGSSNAPPGIGRLRPFLNGAPLSGASETVFDLLKNPAFYGFGESWSSQHFAAGLAKGWHSFGIRLASSGGTTDQTIRVRCRHLDYVYFK